MVFGTKATKYCRNCHDAAEKGTTVVQLYNVCEVSNYSFCASLGWLSKFKRRFGIRLTRGLTTACAQPDSENTGIQVVEEPLNIIQ